jgi:TrkA domain protein
MQRRTTMSDIEIGQTRLPGVGWRYEMPLAKDTTLFVVVEERGRRHLLLSRKDEAEPWASVPLSEAQSLAVASLLSGANFTLVPGEAGDLHDRPSTVVESVEVTQRSAIAGELPGTVSERITPYAELLGVVSDETPQILEGDPDRRIEPGDRVIIAALTSHREQVLAALEQ